MAKGEIEELHPIRKTPLDVAFPVLFWPWGALKRCCKGEKIDDSELRAGLLNAGNLMDKFANSNDPQVKKRLADKAAKEKRRAEAKKLAEKDFANDPIGAFGFGLIAYRGTLGSLVAFYFIISLLIAPIIYEYEEGHAINPNITQTAYGIFSIANLGYSSVQCQSVALNMKSVVLTCPNGNIEGIVDTDWASY